MNPNLDFGEQCQVVSGFLPADMNSGAGAGDWVSLKNYEKLTIVFFKGAGTATQDPTVQLIQGKTSAGGTPLALDVIDRIYVKQNTVLTAEGTFTLRTQTADQDFVGDATSAEEAGLYIIDIYAEDLADEYEFVQASVANVGANPQLGCILYFLWPPRYGEQTLLSAIA